MLESFKKVAALDAKINEAYENGDITLADCLQNDQDKIMAEIEANGWRDDFDEYIESMN